MILILSLPAIFQSTRPVRGATEFFKLQRKYKCISIHAPRAGRDPSESDDLEVTPDISIHAPRAGRDKISGKVRRNSYKFQSTRPVRGATANEDRKSIICHISIHAPRAGRDSWRSCKTSLESISIHAPRAGRDRCRALLTASRRNFNPRAPCGARLGRRLLLGREADFNPRAPCGARQQKYTKLLYTLLRQKAILRQFHAKRRLLKRFSTYKYRNTFLICSANRMGKICTLPLRTTRSLDLPEGMSACSQSARFCFRTFFPSSKTADYPALDP